MKIEDFYEKTKARKIEIVTKLLKYHYAGYMVRDSKEKWIKIVGVRSPEGAVSGCIRREVEGNDSL